MNWWFRILMRVLPKPRPVEYKEMDEKQLLEIIEAVLAKSEARKQQDNLGQPR